MRAKKRSVNTKVAILLLATVFAVCGAISGSVAWLIDSTDNVKSTFMVGNINITMSEQTPVSTFGTTGNEASDVFYMTPGKTLITNAPVITVTENSEQCYLFVKIVENMGALPQYNGETFKDYLYYEVPSDWIPGNGYEVPVGVYYRVVYRSDEPQLFEVILNNKVTVVGNTVTKQVLDDIEITGLYPELTFSAYAVQYYSTNDTEFTPQEAWEMVSTEMN